MVMAISLRNEDGDDDGDGDGDEGGNGDEKGSEDDGNDDDDVACNDKWQSILMLTPLLGNKIYDRR